MENEDNSAKLDGAIPMVKLSKEMSTICHAEVELKCLIVGSDNLVKTEFALAMMKQHREVLSEVYFRTSSIFNHSVGREYQSTGTFNHIVFVDVPDEYLTVEGALRKFQEANLICYCFDMDKYNSLAELPRWIREFKEWLPHKPSILVGVKANLRFLEIIEPLPSGGIIRIKTPDEGDNFRKKYKIDKYYEFSEGSEDEKNKLLAGMFELVINSKSKAEACSSKRNVLHDCCSLL